MIKRMGSEQARFQAEGLSHNYGPKAVDSGLSP